MRRPHRLRSCTAAGLAVLLGTTTLALGAVGGTYNGSGPGVTITIQASKRRVSSIVITCDRGAVTVQATGPFPRISHRRFTYSGGERTSGRSDKRLKMRVTGSFAHRGRTVSGTEGTSGQCPRGAYTASK